MVNKIEVLSWKSLMLPAAIGSLGALMLVLFLGNIAVGLYSSNFGALYPSPEVEAMRTANQLGFKLWAILMLRILIDHGLAAIAIGSFVGITFKLLHARYKTRRAGVPHAIGASKETVHFVKDNILKRTINLKSSKKSRDKKNI